MSRLHPLVLTLALAGPGCGRPTGPPLGPGGWVQNVSDADLPALVGTIPRIDCAAADYPGLVGFIPADTPITLPPGFSQPWEPDPGARCFAGVVGAPIVNDLEQARGQLVIDVELAVTEPLEGVPTDNVLIADPAVPEILSPDDFSRPPDCSLLGRPTWFGGSHTGEIIDVSETEEGCSELTILDAELQDWVIGLCGGPTLPYAVGETIVATQEGSTFDVQTDSGARRVLVSLDISGLPSWVTASSPHGFDDRTEGLREPVCAMATATSGSCQTGLGIEPVIELGGTSAGVPWGTSLSAEGPEGAVEITVYDASTPLFPGCSLSLAFAIAFP